MDFGYGAPVGHAYERWLLRRFAHRLLQHETRHGRQAPRAPVARWFREHRALLGLGRRMAADIKADDHGRVDRANWRMLSPVLEGLGETRATPEPSSLEKRLCGFREMLALGPADAQLFGALARAVLSQPLRELIKRLEGSDEGGWFEQQTSLGALSIMLAAPQSRLRALVTQDAPLARYGFVDDRSRGEIGLTRRALSILRVPASDSAALRRHLLGPRVAPALAWARFAHTEGHEIAASVLGGAPAKRARGVNILFYGAHGAGKSEFARSARVSMRRPSLPAKPVAAAPMTNLHAMSGSAALRSAICSHAASAAPLSSSTSPTIFLSASIPRMAPGAGGRRPSPTVSLKQATRRRSGSSTIPNCSAAPFCGE